jgi:hypothetical protein
LNDIESDYLDYENAKSLDSGGRPHGPDAARSMLWTVVALVAGLFLVLAGIGWLMR